MTFRTMYRTLILLVLFLAASCAAFADETITVAPSYRYAVNGVSDMQPIRGMVVNGSSEGARNDLASALRMPGTRLYLWVDFGAADEPAGLSNYNLGAPDRIAWLLGHDMDKFVHDQFDRHLGIDPVTGKVNPKLRNPSFISVQYHQLDSLVQWGATKNVTLHVCQPHPRDTGDFAQYSRFYRAIVREVRGRYPQLQVRHLMLYNEPNISYLKREDGRDRAARIKLLYDLYKYVAADLTREFPDVTLIAPSLSQFREWRDWDDWTVPFLNQASDSPYFGAQIYSRRFDELLGWNGMLQAKSLAQRGRRMPMAITEWNPESLDTGSLPGAAEYWRDKNEVSRVALTAEALFGMMRHPDQFALADYFFYDCSHNGYDLIQQHDGTIAPTAAYWLFWALRDMSGARVYAGSDTASSPVNAIASVDGGRLTVALWNSAPVERRIRLFELRRSGAGLGRIRVDRLRYDASTEAFVHGTDDAKAWPESVTLAPGEVRVVSGDLPPGFKYAASLNERDVYADQTAVTVGIGSVEVKLPGMSVARNEQAYLRMAFSCDDMGAARRIDLTLNGHPVRCPMEPDAREEKPRTVAYLDIPVPAVWLANPNRIVLAPAPTPYKLMFASLAALPRPGGAPGLQSLPAVSEAENRVDVDASLPAEARPGENRLTITVRSRAAHPLKFHIAISSPAGWSVLTAPESVNVPANGVARAECVLRAPEGRLREAVAVRVVLTSGGLPDQDVICHTTYQPNLLAAYVASPPVLDGNDIGWPAPIDVEDQPALSSGGNSYRTETRLAWDAAYLYVCVRVTGRELMTVAAGKEPWGRDTMEAFFDFANAKRAKRGPGTIQSVSVLQRDDTHAPDAFDSVVDANGSPVTRACPAGRRIAVVREANGFVAQAAFPWRDLAAAAGADDATAFTPKDGSRIGFELALAGRSVVSGGSAASEWPTPSRWGTLTLVPASPGLQVTQRQP